MKKNGNVWKRLLALGLSLTIAAGCFGGMEISLQAQEDTLSGNELHETLSGNQMVNDALTESGNSPEESGTVKEIELSFSIDTSDFPEHEELLGLYVDNVLYSELYGEISTFGNTGESRLTDPTEKKIYTILKTNIKNIAEGKRASTVVDFGDEISFTWTAKDLGVTKLTEKNVENAVFKKIEATVDLEKVMNYLLMDCPYEFYWFDKNQGMNIGAGISYTEGQSEVEVSSFVITMEIADEFEKDEHIFNTLKATLAKKVKTKAKEIVDQAADYDEFGKLSAFKNAICKLTSYDTNKEGSAAFQNPWEILWVFDGDTSTKVGCEGYSKAFQYLCDLAGLECYTVYGEMNDQHHMWNIVTLYGKNYLVDITSCDTGAIGAPDQLFLAGTQDGGLEDGYVFSLAEKVTYRYDPAEIEALGEDVLKLSTSKFDIAQRLKAVTLKVDSVNYRKIKLSWTKSSYATGYKIYRKNSDGKFVLLKTINSGDTLSYTNTGLSLNKSYSYKIVPIVETEDKTYQGTFSAVVTGKTKALAAVTLKAVSSNYNKIKLSWTKNSNADGYKIYRKNDKGSYVLIKTITSNSTLSYTDGGRSFHKTYYYKIAPIINLDGTNYKGTYSSVVSAKTKLLTPKNNGVKNVNYKKLKISWSQVSGASGYEIYRSTSLDGTYKLVKRVTSATTLSYNDETVTPNKRYYYKVRAYRTKNDSRIYGSFSAKKSGKSMFKQVTDLKVKSVDYSTLRMSWEKVTGASKYQVYYSTSKDSGYKRLATVTGNSYTWKDAVFNQSYYLKVRAIKTVDGKSVYGTYSPVVSARTKLTTPKISAVNSESYKTLKITWNKISGAGGYEIYRSTALDGTYKMVKRVTSGSTLSYKDSTVTPNKQYYYKVRAYKSINGSKIYGSFSAKKSGKSMFTKVTALKANTADYSTLKISWAAVSGASKYQVYYSTSKDSGYQKLATVTGNGYTWKKPVYGKTYYIKVRAIKTVNGKEIYGSYSSVISAKVSLGTITELKTGKHGEDAFKISWKAAEGVTSYKVYRATSKTGTYTVVGTVTDTYYVDDNMSSSKVYYYKVIGYRGALKTATAGPVSASETFLKYGVDVSEYQGSIDWEDVKDDGIDFAMLRIVKGRVDAMETDARFEEYYKEATAAGVKVGVYRYCYATSVSEAQKEARKVVKVLNGRKLGYPVVLDVEDNCMLADGISNSTRSKMILAFKKIVEDAGYEFAVYANLNWINTYLDMELLENENIWLARWRAFSKGPEYTGPGNLMMWQYSSAGKVDGIDGYVDLDVSF